MKHLLFLLIFSLPLFSHSTFAITQSDEAEFQEAPININTASLDDLTTLPGIGRQKANAIIEYRNTHGDYSNVEELLNIKGIGKKLLLKLDGKVAI
jgi:competence protein ComEA